MGRFPCRSRAFLSAPLSSNNLIDLVDLISSAALTAKWRGVRPLESYAFTLAPHATKYASANSAPANAAQWRVVLFLKSAVLMFNP